MLRPIGKTEVTFTLPSPLQFVVEPSSEDYSRKRLFRFFSNIKYEWRHNDSLVSDRIRDEINEGNTTISSKRLVIPQTTSINAGTYSVRIDSFGFKNYANKTCAMILLQALKSYAIFQPVEFHAKKGKGYIVFDKLIIDFFYVNNF